MNRFYRLCAMIPGWIFMPETHHRPGRIRGSQRPACRPWASDNGFVSVSVMVLMLVMVSVSLELADRSGLKINAAFQNRDAIQVQLGRQATVEYGLWLLTRDTAFRTASAGQPYGYAGTTYTLKVLDCTVPGYEDAVMITASAAGSSRLTGIGVRLGKKPLIIADTWGNRIRKLDQDTGIITTIAGDGQQGSSGDGGPATSARLRKPQFACSNSKGEIFIADTDNHVVRKIDTCGTITVFAGTSGNTGYAGDNGPAVNAKMEKPMGVIVDAADNLYIVDHRNHAVRRVDDGTGIITTVAGTGVAGDSNLYEGGPADQARLDEPTNVAFDSAGNYFITDSKNNLVLRVDAAFPHILTVYAGQNKNRGKHDPSGDWGPATDALLDYPYGLAIGPGNHVFVTDYERHTVRRVDAATKIITRVAGVDGTKGYNGDDQAATGAHLNWPSGMCISEDNDLYIADPDNNRIRKVEGWEIKTVAGTGADGYSGDGGPGTAAKLNYPYDVKFGVASFTLVPELCR